MTGKDHKMTGKDYITFFNAVIYVLNEELKKRKSRSGSNKLKQMIHKM